jgi:proteasome lid subunit RPN8/RPN11
MNDDVISERQHCSMATFARKGGMIHQYSLEITPLIRERLPARSLADFGVKNQNDSSNIVLNVLLSSAVSKELNGRPFSNKVEEGGFLVGCVYSQIGYNGNYIIHITGVHNAQRAEASDLHFCFSGESFSALRDLLRSRPQDRLLGWYHTHLFDATEEMGLSSIDVRLHLSTFTLPWHIAALINLGNEGRTLRFYGRHEEHVVLYPHCVLPETY